MTTIVAPAVRAYLAGLQQRIVEGLEAIDRSPFRRDEWTRPEGGGGVSRLIEHGNALERGGVLFSHVLGDKLPASATDGYTPVVDNQEAVTIKVIEGDPEHPVDHEDNVVLKEWDVDITPPRPVSEAGFTVTYSYDVDGILNVKVVDSQTEAVRLDEQLSFGVARSKADLVEIRKRIDGMPGGTAPSGSCTW